MYFACPFRPTSSHLPAPLSWPSSFLAIGLGGLINWNLIWAVALIAIGRYVLLRGLLRPR
jgi:hypothetical protein